MFSRLRLSATLALSQACLIGGLCLSGAAAAQTAAPSRDAPEMRSLLTPELLQAKAAFQAGNLSRAAALLRSATQHGNSLAEAMLGRMYFEGKGVPKNPSEGLRLLNQVIERHQEPGTSIAIETLNGLKASAQSNGAKDERDAVMMGEIRKALQNPLVREYIRRQGNTRWVTCGEFACW